MIALAIALLVAPLKFFFRGRQMDMMDIRTVGLPNCFYLALNAHSIDNKKPSRRLPAAMSLDCALKCFTNPGSSVYTVKSLT